VLFRSELDKDDLNALKDLVELAEHELMAAQLATLDDLTKIPNRRGFVKLAQHSLDICARHKIHDSLVFFDLDKFKSINDTFGHAEGDKTLIEFSTQMQKTFRDSYVIGRLVGDEFSALLTDASHEVANKVV